jgi:hypothetical protein
VPKRSTKTSISLYNLQPEPSVTFGTRESRGINALASDVGRKYGQNEVLVFRALKNGADTQHTLSGVRDPRAAHELLREKYGVEAGRIEGRKIVIVDSDTQLGGRIKAAADELGATHRMTPGYAKFVKKGEFDDQIQHYESSGGSRK